MIRLVLRQEDVYNTTVASRVITLQKRILRIISNSHYLAHTSPIFKQLSILPLYTVYIYHICIFVFKYLNNVLPICCEGIFTLVNTANIKHATRRVNVLENPFCRTSIRESCISVIGARLWNDLPSVLQKIKSFSHFKTQLKIYLQELASTN